MISPFTANPPPRSRPLPRRPARAAMLAEVTELPFDGRLAGALLLAATLSAAAWAAVALLLAAS